MQLDTPAIVRMSIRRGFREPSLWAFGTAITAMAFAPAILFRMLSMTDPMHPMQVALSLLGQLARTVLLVGLSRQCLAIVRGERPLARDTFSTVGKNWASILLLGLVMCAGERCAMIAMHERALRIQEGQSQGPFVLSVLLLALALKTINMMLPVLANETVGPFGAMRRTAQILVRVWWPCLRGSLSIGLRFVLAILLVVMLGVALMVAWQVPLRSPLPMPLVVINALLSILWYSIFIACDQLFDAAVYTEAAARSQ